MVAQYADLQRKNFSTAAAAASLRRPLEERIRELEEEEAAGTPPEAGWLDRALGNGGIFYPALRQECRQTLSSRFRRRRARRSPSEKAGKPVDEMNEDGGGQGVKKSGQQRGTENVESVVALSGLN